MKLYHFPSSLNCLKVRAVAYELGVRLELVTVNIVRRETNTPFFRALNPNALVPVLVDGDFVLWESNAIMTYLATTHRTPSLLSTDVRERADADRWLHWQSAHLGPALSRIAFEGFVKPLTGCGATDASAVAIARCDFARHCGVLEASLISRQYVATRLSVADFALACVLIASPMVGLDLRAYPKTGAWLERMLGRESLQRALAEAQTSISAMYEPGPWPAARR